jgi:hypothetical protein
MAAVLAVSSMCLLQRCAALESNCDNLPRIVSAFGAEDNPGPDISLAPAVSSKLPGLRHVRRVLDTNLSPSGEQIVIYDSDADESDPRPKMAFLLGGRVVKLFDGSDLSPRGGGFERYLASCEFDLAKDQRAFAIAVSSGYDGDATAFAIIRWQSSQYQIVFNPIVGQGRMELGALKLELWSTIWGKVRDPKSEDFGNYECVWCPHRYRVTEYLWRNGRYVKTGSYRTKKAHDPADISGISLLVKARIDKEE